MFGQNNSNRQNTTSAVSQQTSRTRRQPNIRTASPGPSSQQGGGGGSGGGGLFASTVGPSGKAPVSSAYQPFFEPQPLQRQPQMSEGLTEEQKEEISEAVCNTSIRSYLKRSVMLTGECTYGIVWPL